MHISHFGGAELMQVRHRKLFRQVSSAASRGRSLFGSATFAPTIEPAVDSLIKSLTLESGVTLVARKRIIVSESRGRRAALRHLEVMREIYTANYSDVGIEFVTGNGGAVWRVRDQLLAMRRFLPVVPVWIVFVYRPRFGNG